MTGKISPNKMMKLNRIKTLLLFSLSFCGVTFNTISAQESTKTVSALIIGGSDYKHMHDLKSSAKDTKLIAGLLKSNTDCIFPIKGNKAWDASVDLTRAELVEQLSKFRVKAASSHITIFYYSGHSAQVEGEVYLLAKDAMIGTSGDDELIASDIKKHGIPLSSVVTDTRVGENALGSIYIIDGCRTGANITKDKANVSFNRSIVAFSASASEQAKSNSDYTATLVDALKTGSSVKDALMLARNKIIESSNREQKPQLSVDAEAESLAKYVLSPARAIPVDTNPLTGVYKGTISLKSDDVVEILSERTITVGQDKTVSMHYKDSFPKNKKAEAVSGAVELNGEWEGNTFHGVGQTVLETGYKKWVDESFTLIFNDEYSHAKATFWYNNKSGKNNALRLGSDFLYRQK